MARISSALLALTALFGTGEVQAHSSLIPTTLTAVVAQSGWLGVYLANDSSRPKVSEVVAGSPAAKAGIRAGDVFLAVNGRKVGSVDDLMAAMGKLNAGAKVKLRMARGDKLVNLAVVLTKRPDADAPKPKAKPKAQKKRGPAPKPAVEHRVAPKRVSKSATKPRRAAGGPKAPPFLGLALEENGKGLLVAEVLKGGPAAKAGLRKDDLITEIADQDMKSLASLDRVMSRMRAGQTIEIEFVRSGKEKEIEFVLGARPGSKAKISTAKSRPVKTRKAKASKAKTRPAKTQVRTTSRPARAKKMSATGVKAAPQRRVGSLVVESKPARSKSAWGDNLRAAMGASKKSGKPVIVVFGADWCVNCKALKKSFADASVKRQLKHYEAVWLDAEKESKLADRFRVQGLPHIAILVGGKPAKTMTGYYPAEHLAKSLSAHKGAKPLSAASDKPRQVRRVRAMKRQPAKGSKAKRKAPVRKISVRKAPVASKAPGQQQLEKELKSMRSEMRKMRSELGKIDKMRKELRQLRGAQKDLAEIKKLLKELAGDKKRD